MSMAARLWRAKCRGLPAGYSVFNIKNNHLCVFPKGGCTLSNSKYRNEHSDSLPDLMTKEQNGTSVLHSNRSGNMEVLVLDEKVNPKEFAEILQGMGADEEIEYIQPDFRMEYAALDSGLSLTLLTDDESTELSNTESDTEEKSANPGTESPESTADIPEVSEIEAAPETLNEEDFLEEAGRQPSQVTVAILDTGIDITHPGLTNYIWNNKRMME